MWYLIIPPFIVIFGLGVLLWYLSRRMDDPTTIEKMEALKHSIDSGAHSRSLDRKAFFLKLLEKNASRSKTVTLRIHNFFQHSLEGLREKRKRLDETRKAVEERRHADAASAPRRSLFGRRKREAESVSLEEPVVASRPEDTVVPTETERPRRSIGAVFQRHIRIEPESSAATEPASSSEEAPGISEPVLRRTVAKPDVIPEATMKRNVREESLIARIAENPRDAAAYEELGDHYFAAQNMQDAKACYRQVIKLHPTNRAVKIKIRRLEKFFEDGSL